jgi:TonB family protein
MDSLEMLLEATFASSTAIVLVLLLRRPLRMAFGARVAYGAWALLPASIIAVLLPAAERVPGAVPVLGFAHALPAMAMQPAADTLEPRLLLVACWIAGAAACTLWLAVRQWRFRRSLGRLRMRPDGACEPEREVVGLPATLGLWSPLVVVPAAFETRYDPVQRELMLAHECAHVRRGDVQANGVAALLRCVFWFNPLLHLAAPRFRQDQELACDATVLARHPGSRRRYGEALLQAQLDAQASPLGCHFGFGHPLRERFAMLEAQLPSMPRRLLGSALVSILALASGFAAWAAQPPRDVATQSARDIEGASLPPPTYPAYAAEHNLSGRVVLLVDVAADGSVTNAVIETSSPEGVFDAAALKAVQGWKFNPAIKDGKAIAGRVRVPVEFDGAPLREVQRTSLARTPLDPAFDWIKVDHSKDGPVETLCDKVMFDSDTGESLCGIRKQ